MGVRVGDVDTFREVAPDKARALKPLEEAAEVFGAWQMWGGGTGWPGDPLADSYRSYLLDECADVIQATCNLVAALGVEDFSPYMARCRGRNEERGRM